MKRVVITVAIGIMIIAGIIVCGQMFKVQFVNVEFDNGVTVTNEESILSLADIDTNTNIFVLDEKQIKERIENGYENNAIKVTDIVRSFPNKVTIKVMERVSLYKIKAETETQSGYVSVDRNFQRNKIYSYEELKDEILINVTGISINNSFKSKECYQLQSIANALISNGIQEEALPYFINDINFNDTGRIIINLRITDTKFVIDTENNENYAIGIAINSLMNKYFQCDYDKRDGITVFP